MCITIKMLCLVKQYHGFVLYVNTLSAFSPPVVRFHVLTLVFTCLRCELELKLMHSLYVVLNLFHLSVPNNLSPGFMYK